MIEQQVERQQALAALAKAKEMEALISQKLKSKRIDPRTTICAMPEKLKHMEQKLIIV